MARFYESKHHYLASQDAKYYFFALILLGLIPLSVWMVSRLLTGTGLVVAALVGIAILALIAEPLARVFLRKSGQFSRGRAGERAVRKVLEDLPDSYAVFPDVMLPGSRGNLDFVLVGPPGVVLIEAKSHGGEIGYDGRVLTLNGHPLYDKDFLHQAHVQMRRLKDYLHRRTGVSAYIHPAIVFSHPHATMRFGYFPINGIYAVQKDFFPGLLLELKRNENFPQALLETAMRETIS